MDTRAEIGALRDLLRAHGLQATAARIGVLQVLLERHDHLTVDEIRTEVLGHYPAIDPATIYRTLETLEENGLAVRGVLGDKVTRWAHVTDSHHHLVCRHCRTVVELDDAPFQRLARDLAESYGVQLDRHHLVIGGLCARCAASIA